MSKPPIKREPDREEARRFLGCMGLDPERDAVTFQAFDDRPEKRPELARILHGTLAKCWPELVSLSERGAGIFWCVNQTDLRGRRAENIVSVRALFVDLDGAPLDPLLTCDPRPHVRVESSPGRYHAYWRVSDVSLEEFTPLQAALAEKFQGDPSVKDLPRVMRVPGFLHQKGEPFVTRIVADDAD